MARQRDAARRHAPRRSDGPALDPGPPPGSVLHRHPHERHAVRAGGGHHARPHAGQGMHVTMAVDVRDAHSGRAQPGKLRAALLRHVLRIDAPGECARHEAGEAMEPTGVRMDQAAALAHRLPGGEVQVQPDAQRPRATQRRDRVLPPGSVHQHRDRRHDARGVRFENPVVHARRQPEVVGVHDQAPDVRRSAPASRSSGCAPGRAAWPPHRPRSARCSARRRSGTAPPSAAPAADACGRCTAARHRTRTRPR